MNNDLAAFFDGHPFDPSTVEPQGDFPVFPPGKYPVLIEKAEVRQTKKGTGHYIYLEMSLLDGSYKGQKLFDRINIQNPSTQCEEIGLRTLSALGQALGLQALTDTAQLLNQIVIAHVKVKDDQNIARTYSAAGQPRQPVAAQPEVPQVTPHESAPNKEPKQTTKAPPWAAGAGKDDIPF